MSSSPIPPPILLATDFCEPARRALLVARRIAHLGDAAVRAIHVIDLTENAEARQPSVATARQSAERMLRDVRRELRLFGVRESATLITAGRPAPAIRDAAIQFQSGLLVIGLCGARHRLSAIGSTARALLSSAPCPVLAVSATCPERPAFARVQILTDGDAASLEAALRITPPAPDQQLSVSAVCSSGATEEPEAVHNGSQPPVRILASHQVAAALLAGSSAARPDLVPNFEPDLVIVAFRTGSHLDTLSPGAPAHTLLTTAPCPVLTVRI